MKQRFIVNLERLNKIDAERLVKKGAEIIFHTDNQQYLSIELNVETKRSKAALSIEDNTLFIGYQWVASFTRDNYKDMGAPLLTFALTDEPFKVLNETFFNSSSSLTFFSRNNESDDIESPRKKIKSDDEPMDESSPYNSPRY